MRSRTAFAYSPVGVREPFSQCHTAISEQPINAANATWESPKRRRNSRIDSGVSGLVIDRHGDGPVIVSILGVALVAAEREEVFKTAVVFGDSTSADKKVDAVIGIGPPCSAVLREFSADRGASAGMDRCLHWCEVPAVRPAIRGCRCRNSDVPTLPTNRYLRHRFLRSVARSSNDNNITRYIYPVNRVMP